MTTSKNVADALAGATGTLLSLWAFYPLEVIKTNLQASLQQRSSRPKSTQKPMTRSKDRSFLLRKQLQTMFQGCSTKTLHALSSSFCYFFLYSSIESAYRRRRKQQRLLHENGQQSSAKESLSSSLHPLTRLLLSALAAMMNTLVTLPLDVLSSQHALEASSSSATKHRSTSNVDKMNGAWNDLVPTNTVTPASSASSSEQDESDSDALFHEALSDEPSLESSGGLVGNDTDCGYLSITNNTRGKRMEPLDKSLEVIDIDNDLPSENGNTPIRQNLVPYVHLWKGLTPALILCSNPAIHYTVYDILKNRILSPSVAAPTIQNGRLRRLSMPQAFLLGLVTKFVATIATYPLIRAKVLLMVTSETSLWSALVKSYRHDGGIRGLYKGCGWQLLHTLLKSALMMMVRERITEQTHRWIAGAQELQ